MRTPRISDLAGLRPPLWPEFRSPLHSEAVVARVGRVLGIFLSICFVTGLLSLYQYQPWNWLPEPATPAWGYRLTQGLHVITGIASIPLLFVKLWAVYPRLFEWPPVRSVVHALERLSIAVLVSVTLVELFTGFFNVLDWYPWPWDFITVHRYLAYVVFGSLLLHVAVKLPRIRSGLATPLTARTPDAVTEPTGPEPEPVVRQGGLSRRGLLVSAGGGVGLVVLTTVGQTVGPLHTLAVLAPRQADQAPQSVPVNKTVEQAGVRAAATSPDWRLRMVGPRPFELTLAQVEALPDAEHQLPLACVEGWSVDAQWRGPLLIDMVRRAGGNSDSHVRVTSLERGGSYRTSEVFGPQLSHAVLATHLNGVRLDLDHGYPLRLIAPDRAGVFNTKWLTEIEILR